ncbi:MAG: cytochrome b N-terminal domain-containing protein, partial [Gammaproteobacteria bacterium]|nr:cytochrome b N-terminal domain-containing protein [Gammaproteobacteria bacterium]
FFIVVYLHMFRGLMYGSFKSPRELVWLIGMGIFLCLMAEAFFGYLLPWGQMSYWGAQVIISLFGAIPFVGEPLSLWIRGDYVVSDATLNRFFSLHVVALPMALVGLVGAHIFALHEVGSNNPDGVEIKKYKNASGVPRDGIPFHPYYTVKDLMGAAAFLFIFCLVVFFFPEFNGWFLEKDNFVPADPLQTPAHIMPVWYFTPYYAILRAVPDKLLGVVSMGAAVLVFAVLPWLDRNPVKSIRYRSRFFRWLVGVFVATFLILGYLGTQPAQPHLSELGFRLGEIYFLFFFMLLVYSKPRSREYMLTVLAVVVVGLLVIDGLRYSPERSALMIKSALIPILYLAIFVLGPIRKPELHQDKPVPEHVT